MPETDAAIERAATLYGVSKEYIRELLAVPFFCVGNSAEELEQGLGAILAEARASQTTLVSVHVTTATAICKE